MNLFVKKFRFWFMFAGALLVLGVVYYVGYHLGIAEVDKSGKFIGNCTECHAARK
ncbi:MAG: hypothetical protein HQL21_08890 [Candidatus Omnitrophica bacterium]|nr:hypothetical protein [Candidatus Omnitrophota bacterium]